MNVRLIFVADLTILTFFFFVKKLKRVLNSDADMLQIYLEACSITIIALRWFLYNISSIVKLQQADSLIKTGRALDDRQLIKETSNLNSSKNFSIYTISKKTFYILSKWFCFKVFWISSWTICYNLRFAIWLFESHSMLFTILFFWETMAKPFMFKIR